jgi:hypothetical protein
MKPTNRMDHGTSRYDYGTGRISKTPPKPEAKGDAPQQRRVMPGDAHDAMKREKC